MYRYFIIKLKDIKQLKLNRRDWKHEETYNFMGVPLLLPDLLFDDTQNELAFHSTFLYRMLLLICGIRDMLRYISISLINRN